MNQEIHKCQELVCKAITRIQVLIPKISKMISIQLEDKKRNGLTHHQGFFHKNKNKKIEICKLLHSPQQTKSSKKQLSFVLEPKSKTYCICHSPLLNARVSNTTFPWSRN